MSGQQNGSRGTTAQRYRVGADPALSAQVRKELLDTLSAKTGYDPERAARELDARDVRAEFLSAFGGLGLAPDNLPDLFAGHFLALWSVVHDAPLPGSAIALAVARQFEAQIARSPQVADAAKRQLMGEALLYEAVLTLEAQREARAGGAAKIKQMADSAQHNFLAQRGIDLRKTRLTASGMQRA